MLVTGGDRVNSHYILGGWSTLIDSTYLEVQNDCPNQS